MKECHLKSRKTRLENHLKNDNLTPTYEKQALKKKSEEFYIDTRKRID